MSSKELILIVLAIIVAGCIIAGAILISSDTELPVNNTTAVNNTTNITENTTVEDITPSETSSSSSQSTFNDEPYVDNYNTRGEVHHNGKTVVGQRYDPDLPGYVFVYDDGSTGTGG